MGDLGACPRSRQLSIAANLGTGAGTVFITRLKNKKERKSFIVTEAITKVTSTSQGLWSKICTVGVPGAHVLPRQIALIQGPCCMAVGLQETLG